MSRPPLPSNQSIPSFLPTPPCAKPTEPGKSQKYTTRTRCSSGHGDLFDGVDDGGVRLVDHQAPSAALVTSLGTRSAFVDKVGKHLCVCPVRSGSSGGDDDERDTLISGTESEHEGRESRD